MNTIESLQALYVKLGGSLTDTYADIAVGVPVSDYAIIPDMIAAITEKVEPPVSNAETDNAETDNTEG